MNFGRMETATGPGAECAHVTVFCRHATAVKITKKLFSLYSENNKKKLFSLCSENNKKRYFHCTVKITNKVILTVQ